MRPTQKKKKKKVSISLSEKEGEMLLLYASELGVSRPTAVRRILKKHLSEFYKDKASLSPQNQLDIFDSLQIDIFNNTSKT